MLTVIRSSDVMILMAVLWCPCRSDMLMSRCALRGVNASVATRCCCSLSNIADLHDCPVQPRPATL